MPTGLITALCGLLIVAQERPRALLAFEQSRKALVSGAVDWRVTTRDGHCLSFRSRLAANGDAITEHRGDENGWTVFGADGAGFSKYPQILMTNREGLWRHQETSLSCRLWERGGRDSEDRNDLREIRGLGVSPTSASLAATESLDLVWGRPDDAIVAWSETECEGALVVSGRSASGAEITWWIDPARGWNATRIEYRAGDATWDVVNTLERFGETWFPVQSDYFENGAVVESVAVERAHFNAPDDPKRFTPADMGVEPGSGIAQQESPGRRDSLTWNGEAVVSVGEWREDVRKGAREWGPMHRAAQARGYWASPYESAEAIERNKLRWAELRRQDQVRRFEGLWDRYVRDFIARYRLDEGQRQKAWAVLSDCRQQAENILRRDLPRHTELLKKREQLAGDARAKLERIDSEIAKLREPLDRIFEKQLKPRLEKLPTRAQRVAAESTATSPAPASAAERPR